MLGLHPSSSVGGTAPGHLTSSGKATMSISLRPLHSRQRGKQSKPICIRHLDSPPDEAIDPHPHRCGALSTNPYGDRRDRRFRSHLGQGVARGLDAWITSVNATSRIVRPRDPRTAFRAWYPIPSPKKKRPGPWRGGHPGSSPPPPSSPPTATATRPSASSTPSLTTRDPRTTSPP